MEELRLSADDWDHGPVLEARSFVDRWRGLRGQEPGASMIFGTSTVHAFGLREPFWAVGLTGRGIVSEVKLVRPRRIVMFRNCRYVMELPLGVTPPPVGARLEVFRV